MNKARILLILGVFITVLPYLGFPTSWKEIIFSLCGLALIYFSYLLYKESKTKNKNAPVFDNFLENSDFSEN
ncbi:MAG: hypothetical protein WD991_00605 [Candidatus Paceibacterota bacterium]